MTGLSRGNVLDELLEVGGVRGAAFVTSAGEILESRGAGEHDLASVPAMLSSCLASNRLLSELLGAEVTTQTTLEFGSGTLLLTRLAQPSDVSVSVVAFTSTEDADRVRFGLRRLLPQLASPELPGPSSSP